MKKLFYELIGRIVIFLAGYGLSVYATYQLMIFILDNCITTI